MSGAVAVTQFQRRVWKNAANRRGSSNQEHDKNHSLSRSFGDHPPGCYTMSDRITHA